MFFIVLSFQKLIFVTIDIQYLILCIHVYIFTKDYKLIIMYFIKKGQEWRKDIEQFFSLQLTCKL